MAIFVISYDLVKSRNYPAITEPLKTKGAYRALESLWVVNLTNDIITVRDWLGRLVDDDDRIFVAEVTNIAALNALGPDFQTWLNKNFK